MMNWPDILIEIFLYPFPFKNSMFFFIFLWIFSIGLWTNWSNWSDSPCSSTCGGGYHTRSRECKEANDPTVDLPSGCAGDPMEVQGCIHDSVPVCPGEERPR